METINGLSERPLRISDINQALALSQEAGWNQSKPDWQFMIEHGHGFGLETQDNRLVATALTLPHGDNIAWISMVL